MAGTYLTPPSSDIRDPDNSSDSVLNNTTVDPVTPPSKAKEKDVELERNINALQHLESNPEYMKKCPTLLKSLHAAILAGTEYKHVSPDKSSSVTKVKKPDRPSKSGRGRGRPPGKSDWPYGCFKGMSAKEVREFKKAAAAGTWPDGHFKDMTAQQIGEFAKTAVLAQASAEAEQHGIGAV